MPAVSLWGKGTVVFLFSSFVSHWMMLLLCRNWLTSPSYSPSRFLQGTHFSNHQHILFDLINRVQLGGCFFFSLTGSIKIRHGGDGYTLYCGLKIRSMAIWRNFNQWVMLELLWENTEHVNDFSSSEKQGIGSFWKVFPLHDGLFAMPWGMVCFNNSLLIPLISKSAAIT